MPSPRASFWSALILCGLVAVFSGCASAQNLSALRDYSVVVSGNLSTNSDVEGRTLVGGNLTARNSSNFGIKLRNQVSSSDPTLRVGGNLSSGNPISLNAGSLELGGSRNGRIVNFNGGGSLISKATDYSPIFDGLIVASDQLAAIQADSTTRAPGSQPGPFRFDATPGADGLAVFLVNGTTLFNNNKVQQIEMSGGGASNILINVSGTSINWQNGNMVGLFTQASWRERIVWNFYEAETINFGSKNMMGQVLAPFASVTTQGNIDGSIFAKNLTTTSEVHLPSYQGTVAFSADAPLPIPEPGSAALAVLGVLVLLARRRP